MWPGEDVPTPILETGLFGGAHQYSRPEDCSTAGLQYSRIEDSKWIQGSMNRKGCTSRLRTPGGPDGAGGLTFLDALLCS